MSVSDDAADRTLVLMVDDRHPVYPTKDAAPYVSLAAALNADYAARHGYHFRFDWVSTTARPQRVASPQPHLSDDVVSLSRSRFAVGDRLGFLADVASVTLTRAGVPPFVSRAFTKGARIACSWLAPSGMPVTDTPQSPPAWCEHSTQGVRAVAWAKLLCINHALRGGQYDRIIYIDSDAFFAQPDIRVDDWLRRHRHAGHALVLATNHPWTPTLDPIGGRQANSGLMVWTRSEAATALLQAWWDAEAGVLNVKHDWEQGVIDEHVLPAFADAILVVDEVTLEERPNQWVRHVTRVEPHMRRPRLRFELHRRGWSDDEWASVSSDVRRGVVPRALDAAATEMSHGQGGALDIGSRHS